ASTCGTCSAPTERTVRTPRVLRAPDRLHSCGSDPAGPRKDTDVVFGRQEAPQEDAEEEAQEAAEAYALAAAPTGQVTNRVPVRALRDHVARSDPPVDDPYRRVPVGLRSRRWLRRRLPRRHREGRPAGPRDRPLARRARAGRAVRRAAAPSVG